jgi:PPP family 3-phenylpropionic acid transporter
MTLRDSLGRNRILYLIYYAALGSVLPYRVLFLESRGLSPTQIGLLGSIAAAAAILPGVMWAAWSDRTGRRRSIILFGFSVLMVLWLAFPLASSFYHFLLLMVLTSLLVPPLEALLNVLVIGGLDRKRLGYGYSTVRIWGSLGWILAAVLTGSLVQATDDLRFAFLVGAGLVGVCLFLPIKADGGQEDDPEGVKGGSSTGVREMLPFASATIIRALSVGMTYTFLSIYLLRIGTPIWMIGWGWAISAAPEIPIMIFAGKLSDRIGRVPLLMGGALCSSLMAFVYAWVESPGLAVPLMTLSGISFALTHIASVGYLADLAPRNRQAMAQSLYVVLTMQLPRVAGPFLGGLIIDRYGLSPMFLLAGMLSLAAVGVLAPLWRGSGGKKGRDGDTRI